MLHQVVITGLDAARFDEVMKVQAACYHAIEPESREVMFRKLELSPHGCFAALEEDRISGYLLSHPWETGSVPTLHRVLEKLPERSDAWHIHDLALLPSLRGTGTAAGLVEASLAAARRCGAASVHLVSIQGTHGFWSRFGFSFRVKASSAVYGDGACVMEAEL